MFVNII